MKSIKIIPEVYVVKRKDFGWEFHCIFCKTVHKHGEGLGHRVAHCGKKTPYDVNGYNLIELVICKACGSLNKRDCEEYRNCSSCGQYIKIK